MNEFNKGNMKWGLKVLLIFVWAILSIATCAMVWNFVPSVLGKVAALALFGFNGVAVVQKGKALSKKE